MNSTIENYYKVLQVTDNASASEIKRAFRTLAKRFHPDANPEKREWAEGRMKKITSAYRVLVDERLRSEHDTRLQQAARFEPAAYQDDYSAGVDSILKSLLDGRGESALKTFDRFSARKGFDLLNYLDMRDYLDCKFLLAEQLELHHRYEEAAQMYEEVYREEAEPPRVRYYFDDLCERIRDIYTRRLVKMAKTAGEKISCYDKLLKFRLSNSNKAFVYKKMAEVYISEHDYQRAEQYLNRALELRPGMKGIAKIRSRLRAPSG